LNIILRSVLGVLGMLFLAANTVAHSVLIFLFGLLKFLAPGQTMRDAIRHALAKVAESWVSLNNVVLGLYGATDWDIGIPDQLDRTGCYLVNCNHQTWVDIPVLQRCFNRRLPFLRFFLKSQLIWVPFLGVAWWALDFPFMKRASKSRKARRPNLAGKDLENARRACEKFRNIPVAMMNFPEGTRFTPEKHATTRSPYRNLLIPRIGGIGQVLYALAEPLDGLLDVTIVYPDGNGNAAPPTLWQLVSGQVPRIIVQARLIDIPQALRGKNFREDKDYRRELDAWIREIWEHKDLTIDGVLSGRPG
jgi:1-acyl-sn-glycerol-3-phosphate acyltransferase